METLLLDDYFDAAELNDFLYAYGWEMYDRTYTAVSTKISIEPLADAVTLEELTARMSDDFFVQIKVL